jgi:putative transcriptional regulator
MVKMKLHILLDKHRISQRELSSETGIRFETINKYTNNSYKYISNSHLNILCRFFNCQISDILEYIKDSD